MASHVFPTLETYVEHLGNIASNATDISFASTFFASHLFAKSAIERFLQIDTSDHARAATVSDSLWRLGRVLMRRAHDHQLRELYEVNTLQDLCSQRLVHNHVSRFRLTAAEIAGVCDALVKEPHRVRGYRVAFTRHRLPFVFWLDGMTSVTIDVTRNTADQRIQGIVIDDTDVVRAFRHEFDRIWGDADTVSKAEHISAMVREMSRTG